jgi:hypothetical protein
MAKTEYIKDKLMNQINVSACKRTDNLDFEVYSFVDIVSNWFDICQYEKDTMIYILKIIMDDYHVLFNQCLVENLVLGCMLFACKCSGYDKYLDLDISTYIKRMYKSEDITKNTIQIYWINEELGHILL